LVDTIDYDYELNKKVYLGYAFRGVHHKNTITTLKICPGLRVMIIYNILIADDELICKGLKSLNEHYGN